MAHVDELRLMTRVARLYHEQGQRQTDIAEQLHLSQATVSRLLKRALQEQIVRIQVRVPPGIHPQLEESLSERFGLQQAIVADCEVDDESHILRSIGSAAAFYLESTLAQDEVIGVSSWSETLLSMVDAMGTLIRVQGVHVVQILGGMGDPIAETHASRLIGRLADRVRGSVTLLPAPGVVGSKESRRVLLQDPFIQQAMSLFDQVTLALVGIGSVEPSKMLASSGNVFASEELDTLRAQGAVGDMLLRFFDANGRPIDTEFDSRVIAMTRAQLGRTRRVVALAGGKRKTEAIGGALQSGMLTVLITDRFTAERLLQTRAL